MVRREWGKHGREEVHTAWEHAGFSEPEEESSGEEAAVVCYEALADLVGQRLPLDKLE